VTHTLSPWRRLRASTTRSVPRASGLVQTRFSPRNVNWPVQRRLYYPRSARFPVLRETGDRPLVVVAHFAPLAGGDITGRTAARVRWAQLHRLGHRDQPQPPGIKEPRALHSAQAGIAATACLGHLLLPGQRVPHDHLQTCMVGSDIASWRSANFAFCPGAGKTVTQSAVSL
jgi:hypothetical protein